MAITFVGAGAYGEGDSSLSLPLPAGTQAGDILVVVTGGYSAASTEAVSGYTLKQRAFYSTYVNGQVFWKRHQGGGETDPVIVTSTNNAATGNVLAFRGCVDAGDPWDAWCATQASGSTDPTMFPSLSTLTGGAMVIAAAGANNDMTFVSPVYGNLEVPRGSGTYKTLLSTDGSHAFIYGLMSVAGDIGSLSYSGGVAWWASVCGALMPASEAPPSSPIMTLKRGMW